MSLTPFPPGARQSHDRFVALLDGLATVWRRFSQSDFGRAAAVSARVIHALLLRESVTRYGRRSAGYVWALIQPMLQVGVMIAVFSFIGRAAPVGDSLMVFFITGVIPLLMFRKSLTQGARAITSNRSLMNYPQVRAFELITARVLLESLTTTLVVLIIIVFMQAFGGLSISAWISEPLELLAALTALMLLSYGTAFLSAQIGRVFQQWSDLTSAMGRLLFFTSGLWYTLETLPPGLRKIVAYNPVAQIIEWIRDASIRGFDSPHINAVYPVAFGLVCLAVGLAIEWLFRITGLDLERR